MTIKPNDIIVKRQDNELPQPWLKESFLLTNLQGLSKTYLDVKARPSYKKTVQPCHHNKTFLPDTGKAWRYAKIDGAFYYAYDNIPDKQPTNYAGQLPGRLKLIELSKEAAKNNEATPIEQFFEEYLNANYKNFLQYYAHCTKQQQINLAKAATFVEAIVQYQQSSTTNDRDNYLYKQLPGIIERTGATYLPKHYRNIKTLAQEAIDGKPIFELIKLKRAGNQNASVHSDDAEIQSWIIEMRKSGRNYSDAYIMRKIEWMCKLTDKPVPSERWMGEFMNQHNIKWLTAGERFGDKGRGGNTYRAYTPLQNAVHAGDCWQVDGTRVNFIDFKLNGKNVFLYIVAVRDVHSGDVLGYSFDISENRWVVHNALKMAVEETGYLPYELSIDRFPGHNTPEMESLFEDLQNRGTKITIGHKATSKAKLERWFSTCQQVFMMGSDYYYGEGIQSRNKFAHRSKEQLKRMKKAANEDGWDFDKSVDEACKIVEAYRSTILSSYSRKYGHIDKSPAQLHAESEKPNVRLLEDHQIIYLFGLRTQKKFTGEGLLNIEIQTFPFSYRCADPAIVSKYDRVTVCYSLEDINQVHLYEITDRPLKKYLGTADEVSVQLYGPDAEWGKLQKQKAIIKNLQEERERQLSMKLAVGSEYTMLMGGVVSKAEYEAEETVTLVNHFNTENGDLGEYNIRDQY